ncbi:hypothetical protein JXA02_05850, partial [candidate division KSB1 bacterium]|nr:hypothetical protein [candidate division KSB1 bacterium]
KTQKINLARPLAATKNIQTTEGTETAEKIDEKKLKFITFTLSTIVEKKNVCFSSAFSVVILFIF